MTQCTSLLSCLPAVFGRSLLQTYAPGPAYNAADCQNLTSTFVATPSYSTVRVRLCLLLQHGFGLVGQLELRSA